MDTSEIITAALELFQERLTRRNNPHAPPGSAHNHPARIC